MAGGNMQVEISASSNHQERLLLSLANEIAMDILPLEDILRTHGLTPIQYEQITSTARFQALLHSAVLAWGSALNTEQRIKLKTLAGVELALPGMFMKLEEGDLTTAKVELFKALQKGAGVGQPELSAADKVSITINMGAAEPLRVEAALPERVIDHEDA